MSRVWRWLLLLGMVATAAAGSDPVTSDPSKIDTKHPAGMAEVAIHSHGSRLNGMVYLAQGQGPHPTVVLLHGFPGNEKNLDVAQAMRRAGFNVLFFHYRGSWGSEGDFSFSHGLEDVAAALAFLRTEKAQAAYRIDARRLTLVGHSMGGFMALQAAAKDRSVRCVVSIAGVNLASWGAVASRNAETAASVAAALDGGTGPLQGTSGEQLRDELVANVEAFDVLRLAATFKKRPVLLVGGRRDAVVPVDAHHQPLSRALKSAGVSMLTEKILDTDHAFSDQRIALTRTVVDWLDQACR